MKIRRNSLQIHYFIIISFVSSRLFLSFNQLSFALKEDKKDGDTIIPITLYPNMSSLEQDRVYQNMSNLEDTRVYSNMSSLRP